MVVWSRDSSQFENAKRNKLTNSTEHSPAKNLTGPLASQEITRML